jgi:hypothetical protein
MDRCRGEIVGQRLGLLDAVRIERPVDVRPTPELLVTRAGVPNEIHRHHDRLGTRTPPATPRRPGARQTSRPPGWGSPPSVHPAAFRLAADERPDSTPPPTSGSARVGLHGPLLRRPAPPWSDLNPDLPQSGEDRVRGDAEPLAEHQRRPARFIEAGRLGDVLLIETSSTDHDLVLAKVGRDREAMDAEDRREFLHGHAAAVRGHQCLDLVGLEAPLRLAGPSRPTPSGVRWSPSPGGNALVSEATHDVARV